MAEDIEIPFNQWATSNAGEKDLLEIVKDNMHAGAKEIIGWRQAFGEDFPTLNTAKIVVFTTFFYSGFGLPTSNFFRGLLESWLLQD